MIHNTEISQTTKYQAIVLYVYIKVSNNSQATQYNIVMYILYSFFRLVTITVRSSLHLQHLKNHLKILQL